MYAGCCRRMVTAPYRLDFDAVVVAAAPVTAQHAAQVAAHPGSAGRTFTNVFVKNFRDDVTDEQFQAAFACCGNITSAVVARSADGKSKRHGFVNFESAEAAADCISRFNGSASLAAAGETIDVVQHLKKSERFPAATGPKPFYAKVRRRTSAGASCVSLHVQAAFGAPAAAATTARRARPEETPEAAAERKAKKVALLMSGVRLRARVRRVRRG